MQSWRLLPLETNNGFMNMAVDEAILAARIADKVPNTLRFYRWQPSTVSVGRNQNPEAEIYFDACKRFGVDVVRRVSGGGAVYHEFEGEVTYGVIAKITDITNGGITAVYAKVYEAIKDCLRLLGITADFSSGDAKNCPNMTVSGKKISGSSQTITRGIVLQHGTLLKSVDLPRMFTLLKLKNATCSQAADIASRKITSIQTELRHVVSADTIANALAQGFSAMLKIQLEPGELSPFEVELASKLSKEKYATQQWVFKGKAA
jgi:lipoate-protein ligase A